LTLGLNGGKFRPFIGVEPYLKEYRHASRSIDNFTNSSTTINGKVASTVISSPSLGASAILGFQIPFSKRLALNASYVRQFTIDKKSDVKLIPLRDVQFQRFDVSLRYHLFKRKNVSLGN